MPITANTTSPLVCTGNWQLIAASGNVKVTSEEGKIREACTATSAAPSNDYHGEPLAHHGFGIYRTSMELSGGMHLWIKGPIGCTVHVLATEPV